MKLSFREIKNLDQSYSFTDQDSWVQETIADLHEVDEKNQLRPSSSSPPRSSLKSPSSEFQFQLRRIKNTVLLKGTLSTEIKLICSRCATPFSFKSQPRFTLLFSKDSPSNVLSHQELASSFEIDFTEDLDVTYLDEDTIDLTEVAHEQLQLSIPFQPLCRENCQGMCQNCGADLNEGQCACSKIISSENPFSHLKNLGKAKER